VAEMLDFDVALDQGPQRLMNLHDWHHQELTAFFSLMIQTNRQLEQ
jgi:hypothetical protein